MPPPAPEAAAQRQTVVIGGDDTITADEMPNAESAGSDEYQDADPSALTDFHSALDPYGQWVEDPSYGTIWEPSEAAVGPGFAPYETAGHWSYGDDYTWVSDYSWGWAPFHYGRWVYATNRWGWIPGRQYAGAWTTWRTGFGAYSDYVGWAPLPPTYYWRNGVAVGIGMVPLAPYGFCRTGDLFASNLSGRMATGPTVGAIGPSSAPVMHGAQTGVIEHPAGAARASNGRTLAHPEVAGPSPASLHIAGAAVTRPPVNNAGLNRAMQFSRPSTAVAMGAHAPAGWRGAASGGSFASSSMGTSAYGHVALGGATRTLGTGATGANLRTYVGGHAVSSFRGGGGHTFYGSHAFASPAGHAYDAPSGYHGGGVHGGLAPAPHSSYQYGEGYHPSSGGGGSFGGGHGGGGHGGGGHGGGHR